MVPRRAGPHGVVVRRPTASRRNIAGQLSSRIDGPYPPGCRWSSSLLTNETNSRGHGPERRATALAENEEVVGDGRPAQELPQERSPLAEQGREAVARRPSSSVRRGRVGTTTAEGHQRFLNFLRDSKRSCRRLRSSSSVAHLINLYPPRSKWISSAARTVRIISFPSAWEKPVS